MAYASSSTFGSLKTKISKKLIDAAQTAISDADVGDAVNDALHYWKQKRFWFNEGQTPAPLIMGQGNPYIIPFGASQPLDPQTGAAYASPAPVLPQDFLYELPADGFVILYSNLSYRFEKVNPARLDDESTQGVGIPYIYCYRKNNFEFYYLPNLNYSMQVNYVKDYQDFVNNADTNDFMAYADRLLMYEALSHLMGENRQDETQDNLFAGKADRESKLLQKRSGASVTSGRIETSNILS